MKLDLKQANQMDSQQILDSLLPSIDNIYKAYDYIGLSKQEYYDLVLENIDDTKITYTSDKSYRDYLKNKIISTMNAQVKMSLLNLKSSVTLVNNYINKKFKKNTDVSDILNNLKKLDSFFIRYDFFPEPDLLIEVIKKNKYFLNMIDKVFKQYNVKITNGMASEIFDDGTTILLIETYCMLQNIEIKQQENDRNCEYDLDYEDIGLEDSIKIYLLEISRRKLLTREEEITLAKRIKEGDLEARTIFIESNLKLVVSVARRYINKGLDFLDLIQEGNIGLIKALDKYDVNSGYKFSTYAIHWIRQSVSRAVAEKGRNIRVPVHLYDQVKAYQKTYLNLEKKLNREPTINEIADAMKMKISHVNKLHKLQLDTVSVNSLVGDDDAELGDFIPSQDESVEDIIIQGTLSEDLMKLFINCKLNTREIQILSLRFGLDGKQPVTLEEAGQQYGFTRERARQIEKKALRKLRNSEYIKSFAIYMNNPDKVLENFQEAKKTCSNVSNNYIPRLQKLKTANKKESENMPKLQTIYQYFKDYTKEQVDTMLSKLNEDEKKLITCRYGEDLEVVASTKLTKEESTRFYGVLIPKMKKLLANPNKVYKERRKTTCMKVMENGTNEEQTKEIILKKEDKIEIQEKEQLKEHENAPVDTKPKNDDMTKEDCSKMLELLRTPNFSQMMNSLTVKEAVIISLRLGYVNEKAFSTEAIAGFLEIDEDEVRETTKKVLLVYKDNITSFLDKVIDVATDKTLTIKK